MNKIGGRSNDVKSIRRRLGIFVAIVLAVSALDSSGAFAAGLQQSLAIDRAITLAWQSNPRVLAAVNERDQAALQATQAVADSEVRPSESALRRATLNKTIAELNLDGVRRQVRRDVERSYFQAVSASNQEEIARKSAENAARLVTATRAKVTEGVASELEAMAADRARADAMNAVETAAEAKRLADANLCVLLGLPSQTELQLVASEIPMLPVNLSEDELLSRGLKNSVEVARANVEQAAASAEVAAAVAGGTAPIPRRLAELAEEHAKLAIRQAEGAVAIQARQLLNNASRTKRDYELAQADARQAAAALTAAQSRYDEGLIVTSELVKAEVDVASARIALEKALLEYQLARLEALDFMGVPEQEVAR